ncbi:hypothetical protein RF11_03853 [Thelohanellus kitauei]|uniref:Uncharacterized protein n=1 Tax=Thelohanellus kitauei TaxID=669202 RepID=A0A0C2MJC2_THEKT|nr:hypothetical protein RF11_03853 [Thelohanellus kitauei]
MLMRFVIKDFGCYITDINSYIRHYLVDIETYAYHFQIWLHVFVMPQIMEGKCYKYGCDYIFKRQYIREYFEGRNFSDVRHSMLYNECEIEQLVNEYNEANHIFGSNLYVMINDKYDHQNIILSLIPFIAEINETDIYFIQDTIISNKDHKWIHNRFLQKKLYFYLNNTSKNMIVNIIGNKVNRYINEAEPPQMYMNILFTSLSLLTLPVIIVRIYHGILTPIAD